MSFYLVTPANWNRCIRQAGSKAAATKRAAIEFPGQAIEVELVGPTRLASLKALGLRLPTNALALVKTWSAKQAEMAVMTRKPTGSRARAQKKVQVACEARREAKAAEKAEARRQAQNERDAARRVARKAEWEADAAAAANRGEPFADREAQRVYMQGTRSLAWQAKRQERQAKKMAEVVPSGDAEPEIEIDDVDDWDGNSAPW